MALQLHSLTFRSPDPRRDAEFWGAMLDRSPQVDGDAILLPGTVTQLGLRFAAGGGHGASKNRLHLHLTETDRRQRATIDAGIAAGGRLLGNGHVPENSYAVMADAVGDQFCVIEDGNGYLAGCGPLGEVTCTGSPAVGHFWSRALEWLLVWEVGEETVIQSPAGGTKLAWSGEWSVPEADADRQFFTVTADEPDLDREIDRLVSWGAQVGEGRPQGATLRDPDGYAFELRSRPDR